ncbi:MAG: 5-(carboxyamino)imidazole ribonucleotide synthase [Nitrospira sp.]|nr:5-(carboxyamino)imidazole ribonucleotide synthase [Candidatus Manganitrophaceae bacterium]HIL34189.1 5-(carboxyamino)imidazole ribonucleotide synthase [Candidatus Manganitrophaceae bacterium]
MMAVQPRKLGILGGGQLGMFFVLAARQLGFRVTVWDPNPDAPAGAVADTFISAPFEGESRACQTFLKESEAVTYEWENVPVSLVETLERTCPVRPGSRILRLLQNRILEKRFLVEHKFPVTPFRVLETPGELNRVFSDFTLPAICKTATAGYDGHGQWRLKNREDIHALREALQPRGAGWIIEKWAPLIKELSVIIARNEEGNLKAYPVTENRHEDGILRLCQIPADVGPDITRKAVSLAAEVIAALEGVGVFCVEFFLMENGELLINEIAPRPHNSGHYSMNVATVSQFEHQVRILCGLPLLEVQLLSPAVMVNILGPEVSAAESPEQLKRLLSIPGARLYHYRKQGIKTGRKMGHVTLAHPDPHQALERANKVRALLDRAASNTP